MPGEDGSPTLLETFHPCAGAILILLSRAAANAAGARNYYAGTSPDSTNRR